MGHVPGGGRDNDRNEILVRTERDRQVARTTSPPPQAPQVPAFCSIVYRAPPAAQGVIGGKDRIKVETPQTTSSRSTPLDVFKEAPSGPKVKALSTPPTGPKAAQPAERSGFDSLGIAGSGTELERERHRFPNLPPSIPEDFNSEDTRKEHYVNTSHVTTHLHGIHDSSPSLSNLTYPEPQAASRQIPLQFLQTSGRKDVEGALREPNATANLHGTVSVKAAFHDTPSQHSSLKIPTGPRAERSSPMLRQPVSPPVRAAPIRPAAPQRQQRPANLKWVRPGLPQHTPRGPSIMNTVPTKRDYAGEGKPRAVQPEREPLMSVERAGPRLKAPRRGSLGASPAEPFPDEQSSAKEEARTERANEPKEAGEIFDGQSCRFSGSEIRKSVESNELDPDDMGQDDEPFERQFELKMRALESKRPATPRHHPVLLSLLNEFDALASAAEDLANGTCNEPLPNEPYIKPLPLGLPSPKLEDSDKADLKETPMASKYPAITRRLTPPLESLPFLASGPPTPFSEFEDIQQNPFHQDLVHARITEMLGNQRERVEAENEDIRVDYARKYKAWRLQVEDYEDIKKAEQPNTPAPDSPTPTTLPLVTSTPLMEGRRTGKNVSELDLERVMQASALTHQVEQERRSRETKIPINLEKEAVIPQMLNRYEIKACIFDDRNNSIDKRLAFDVFAFLPKQDDFTAKEQEIFLENYLLYPKKWGTIADALVGRDYQDCVRHYYYTKGEAQYKEKERAFSRVKKGRKGGRGPQGRPKSNALMPSYDGAVDLDAPQIPVTDTGRPRRAAAPTFGDAADGEPATPVATPARRNTAGVKGETNGESMPEKPSGKRGRTATLKEKGPKKSRAPLLAAAPGPSPQKIEAEVGRARSKELKIEGEQRMEEIEGAQLLAGLHSSQATSLPVSQPGTTDGWLGAPSSVMNVPTHTPKPQPPQPLQGSQEPQQPQQSQQQQQPQKGPQPATSSYWSVPEQTDFQNLVHHFGTDWHAIANNMKSKTHTMV